MRRKIPITKYIGQASGADSSTLIAFPYDKKKISDLGTKHTLERFRATTEFTLKGNKDECVESLPLDRYGRSMFAIVLCV